MKYKGRKKDNFFQIEHTSLLGGLRQDHFSPFPRHFFNLPFFSPPPFFLPVSFHHARRTFPSASFDPVAINLPAGIEYNFQTRFPAAAGLFPTSGADETFQEKEEGLIEKGDRKAESNTVLNSRPYSHVAETPDVHVQHSNFQVLQKPRTQIEYNSLQVIHKPRVHVKDSSFQDMQKLRVHTYQQSFHNVHSKQFFEHYEQDEGRIDANIASNDHNTYDNQSINPLAELITFFTRPFISSMNILMDRMLKNDRISVTDGKTGTGDDAVEDMMENWEDSKEKVLTVPSDASDLPAEVALATTPATVKDVQAASPATLATTKPLIPATSPATFVVDKPNTSASPATAKSPKPSITNAQIALSNNSRPARINTFVNPVIHVVP